MKAFASHAAQLLDFLILYLEHHYHHYRTLDFSNHLLSITNQPSQPFDAGSVIPTAHNWLQF